VKIIDAITRAIGISAGPKPGEVETPANAGEGVAMSDNNTAPPPAANGGLSKEDVAAMVKESVTAAVTEAVKPLQEANAGLQAELAAFKESLGKTNVDELVKAATAKLAADQQAVADAQAAAAKKSDVRKKVISKELPGVSDAFLGTLPDTDDEAKLTEAAVALRGTIEKDFGKKLGDIGGASRDGGQAAASSASEGGFLKMPVPAAK
jgi:hypothetical protein